MRWVWLLVAALASPAAAAPCDHFEDPLAYNSCLARQGPPARAVHVGAAPTHAARPNARRIGGRIFVTRPRGRSELVFSPGR